MNRRTLYLLWWMALGLVIGLARVAHTATLGLENHNPGNIRAQGRAWKAWKGATGVDPWAHIIFKSDFHGLRAIRLNLEAYGKRGIDTPYKVAERWGSLKATRAQKLDYCRMLCQASGFRPDQKLDMTDRRVLRALAHGIVRQENGSDPYPASLYDRAFPVR